MFFMLLHKNSFQISTPNWLWKFDTRRNNNHVWHEPERDKAILLAQAIRTTRRRQERKERKTRENQNKESSAGWLAGKMRKGIKMEFQEI